MRSLRNGLILVLLLAACGGDAPSATTNGPTTSGAPNSSTTSPGGETVEFKRALLRVEINSTDEDAGLQIDLDHEPWSSLSLTAPDGTKLLDVVNHGVLEGYGLTELFSESSEPSFDVFPLDEFKGLFPEGVYVFEGVTIDGVRLRSTFTLTHDFPAGPEILSPAEGSTVARADLVVEWAPVTEPAGIEIVRYQVLVINEENSVLQFSAFVPADVHSISVPAEFLAIAGLYKVEVLAIEVSGNQTLTEIEITIE